MESGAPQAGLLAGWLSVGLNLVSASCLYFPRGPPVSNPQVPPKPEKPKAGRRPKRGDAAEKQISQGGQLAKQPNVHGAAYADEVDVKMMEYRGVNQIFRTLYTCILSGLLRSRS